MAAGDPKDFASIYETYFPKITGYLRRIVGEAEAEDVAQEVFVKVHAALDGFRGESRLSTWIYRIATNAAMDHVRKGSSARVPVHRSGGAEGEAVDDVLPDSVPPPDTLLIRKDMNACILGIVNELPDTYRTVLILSDLEGFTNAEIADVLAITVDSVKIRIHRARACLKKELEARCKFYRDERNELACDRKIKLKF